MKIGGIKKPRKNNSFKVSKVLKEFRDRALHSGSKTGPLVKSKKQALAIGYSEARKQANGRY